MVRARERVSRLQAELGRATSMLGRLRLVVHGLRLAEGFSADSLSGAYVALASWGLPWQTPRRWSTGTTSLGLHTSVRRAARHDLAHDIDGVVVKIDDLATRVDSAPLLALPLGHRLQVPTGSGPHASAGYPGERRRDRTGDALRRDGTGEGLRHNRRRWPPCCGRVKRKGCSHRRVFLRKAGEIIPEILGPVVEDRDGTSGLS